MSLIRAVVRRCAVAALLDATLADDRVLDSRNAPLVATLTSEAAPFIGVYTDTDDRTMIDSKEIYTAMRSMSLVLELGLASKVLVDVPGESNLVEEVVQIPYTDEGMEISLDLLEGQAIAALFGDPRSPWAEILRRIVLKVERIPSHRGGSAEKSVRWAARQLTFVLDTISDFPPGVILPEDHPVRAFVALAQGMSPEMDPVVRIITAMINTTEYPEWRQIQAWLGLTRQGIAATGQAPIYQGPEDEIPPELAETTVQHEELSGDVVEVLDEHTIATTDPEGTDP